MKIDIKASTLKAALICAAKKDVRYYLVGVYLEFVRVGDAAMLHVVGTDGHMMFACTDTPIFEEGEVKPESFTMIIPAETVKLATKGKRDWITLSQVSETEYRLGDNLFTPIDGRFPDFRRAMPRSVSGEKARYDGALLTRADDALREYTGSKRGVFYLHQNGESAGAMMADGAIVVIMPMRYDAQSAYVPPYFAQAGEFVQTVTPAAEVQQSEPETVPA